MKFAKKTLLVLLMLSIIVVLPACGKESEPGSTESTSVATKSEESMTSAATLEEGYVDTSKYKKEGKYKIGISGQGPMNDWCVSEAYHWQYATEVAFKDKIEAVYYAHCDGDANKQVANVENLLTKGIDCLILQPFSEAILVDSVEKAMNAGVPVVINNGGILTDNYVSYVDRDNHAAGYIYADFIGERIGGKGDVLVIMGFPGSGYSEDVLRGVNDCLKEKYPNVNVVAVEYAKYSPAESKKIIETYIAKGSDIKGVIVDGGLMAYGVIEAYTDAKKTIPPLTADDWNGFVKKAMSVNFTDYIMISSGNELAYDAVETAIKILEGKPVLKKNLLKPVAYTGDKVPEMVPPDMPDSYWVLNKIPKDLVKNYYK